MDVPVNKTGDLSPLRAATWFWTIAGTYAAIWILLPTLLHTGYRGDVIEVQNIGPEWVWASKRHPMLPAWILEILNFFTCRSFAVPFIATQLCTLTALWSVWRLGRMVLRERLALVGAFSVLPYLFFACKPIWYNQNNVLIAFWCLSICLTAQAFQTNKIRYWAGAGIALGLALHAKYSAVFLVMSILVYMIMRKAGRKYFRTYGPYVTTLIAFLIFLPHIVWLFYNDFVTLSHVANRSEIALLGWFAPLYFAGSQLLYLPCTLIILTPVIGFIGKWKIQYHEQNHANECEKFLFYCFMIPLAFHMLYAGIKGTGLRLEYGAAFWSFAGLWLLLRFQEISRHETRKSLRGFRQAVALMTAIVLFNAIGFAAQFYLGKQHPDLYRPTHRLGVECDRIWHTRYPNVHCPYIAGAVDTTNAVDILVGHAAHAMSVRPSVIATYGTWANDDDLNRAGGMLIWEKDDDGSDLPVCLRQRFPTAEVLPESPELPFKMGKTVHVLKIGVAVVPPPQ